MNSTTKLCFPEAAINLASELGLNRLTATWTFAENENSCCMQITWKKNSKPDQLVSTIKNEGPVSSTSGMSSSNPAQQTHMSKKVKRELIDLCVKPEWNSSDDMIIIDTPSNSQGDINLDDDLIFVEHPDNSFFNISMELDPYDEEIIYMGTTIEPFIIDDDDENCEEDVLYLFTTDGGKSDTKVETTDDCIMVSMDIKTEHTQCNDENKENKNKKKKPSKKVRKGKETSTPNKSNIGKPPQNMAQIQKKKLTHLKQNNVRKTTGTLVEKNNNVSLIPRSPACNDNVSQNESANNENASENATNCNQNTNNIGNTSPNTNSSHNEDASDNVENTTHFTETSATERKTMIDTSVQTVRKPFDMMEMVKEKLAFRYNAGRKYYNTYAKDYQYEREFVFVYQPSINMVRFFAKDQEPEYFFRTFYDLVTAQNAYHSIYRNMMPKLKDYIKNTLMQERLVCMQQHTRIPVPAPNLKRYIFSPRLVYHNKTFITSAFDLMSCQQYILKLSSNQYMDVIPSYREKTRNTFNLWWRFFQLGADISTQYSNTQESMRRRFIQQVMRRN